MCTAPSWPYTCCANEQRRVCVCTAAAGVVWAVWVGYVRWAAGDSHFCLPFRGDLDCCVAGVLPAARGAGLDIAADARQLGAAMSTVTCSGAQNLMQEGFLDDTEGSSGRGNDQLAAV